MMVDSKKRKFEHDLQSTFTPLTTGDEQHENVQIARQSTPKAWTDGIVYLGEYLQAPASAQARRQDLNLGFEVLVIGSGGGPLETNLSSYLVKPYHKKWSEGCLGIDGGSTLGALANLIEASPSSFVDFDLEQCGIMPNKAFLESVDAAKSISVGRSGGGRAAYQIFQYVHSILLTHAHLDHILGLLIASAASSPEHPKPLYGQRRSIENFERIMDGGVWPVLAGWENEDIGFWAYVYRVLTDIGTYIRPENPKTQAQVTSSPNPIPDLEFSFFPVSHGMDPSKFHDKKREQKSKTFENESSDDKEHYDSTAFFIRELASGREHEMLFFGDVEPDSLSRCALNLEVWKVAAPKIVDKKLKAIFIECSYPSSQPEHQLWGHFSPPYLMNDLKILANLVSETRIERGWKQDTALDKPLQGVTIIVTHVKDDVLPLPKSTLRPRAATTDHVVTSTTSQTPTMTNLPSTEPTTMGAFTATIDSGPVADLQLPSPTYKFGSASKEHTYPEETTTVVPGQGGTTGRSKSIPYNSTTDICSIPLYSPTLSLSPPLPSLPRRSSGGPPNSGWGFSRKASIGSYPGSTPNSPRHSSFSARKSSLSNGLRRPIHSVPSNGDVTPLELASISQEENLEDSDCMHEETIRERVERELLELEAKELTGATFLLAVQGMRIAF